MQLQQFQLNIAYKYNDHRSCRYVAIMECRLELIKGPSLVGRGYVSIRGELRFASGAAT